ncbi:hypothetical protein BS17DRAFT_786983 [Gyrodon lividus]|nr:hypothetical protein BS17DRAFT_786983 [Gyrodon lividus]
MSGRNLDTETLSYLPDAPGPHPPLPSWPSSGPSMNGFSYQPLHTTPFVLPQVSTRLSNIPCDVQQFPGPSFPIQHTYPYYHPNSHSFDSTHHEKSN